MKREAIDIIEKIRQDPFEKEPCYLYDNYFWQILDCLGWDKENRNARIHAKLDSGKEAQELPVGIYYKDKRSYLSIVVVPQKLLPLIDEFRNKFVDFNFGIKNILNIVKENFGLKYCVLTDTEVSYLYDADNKEIQLYSEGLDDFELKFLPVLRASFIESSSLEKFPVKTPDLWGKELRFWMSRWHHRFNNLYKLPKRSLDLFFMRLILLHLISSNDGVSVVEKQCTEDSIDFVKLFEIGREKFNLLICREDQELDRMFLKTVDINKYLSLMLKDFLNLSHARFSIPALIAAFDEEDAAQDYVFAEFNRTKPSRIKFVPTTEDYHPLYKVSIDEDGYIGITSSFDEAMLNYALHNNWVQRELAHNRKLSSQLDMFVNNTHSTNKKGIITDYLNRFIESNCFVDTKNDKQKNTAMIILYLKMTEWSMQNGKPIIFPDVYRVFEKKV